MANTSANIVAATTSVVTGPAIVHTITDGTYQYLIKHLVQQTSAANVDLHAPWDLLSAYCAKQEYHLLPDEVAALSVLREQGLGGETKDHEKAQKLRRMAANAGHLPSAKYLAQTTMCKSDRALWLQMASNGGDIGARYQLGKAYLHGKGVTKDIVRAQELFEACGEDRRALRRRGVFLLEQKTVNEALAFDILSRSSEKGDLLALEHMCDMLLKTECTLPHQEQASVLGYLHRAATSGSAKICKRLGDLYWSGKNGNCFNFTSNQKISIVWYEKAAKLGDARSIVQLGMCFEKGYTYDCDPEKAYEFYCKASLSGDVFGMLKQASMLARGVSKKDVLLVAKDCDAAFKLLQQAAECVKEDEPYRCIIFEELAHWYEEREKATKDNNAETEKSAVAKLKWWEKASEAGSTNASKALKMHYSALASKYS